VAPHARCVLDVTVAATAFGRTAHEKGRRLLAIMQVDEDVIQALEHVMSPTGGMGWAWTGWC
jgi:lysyl-tRNA synthetase class II